MAEVLAAVAGDEDQFLLLVEVAELLCQFCLQCFVALDPGDDGKQRVDDGVPGDDDRARRDALVHEVLLAERGGGEVQPCDAAGHLPVDLFRPRRVDVVGPEPCLDVTDGNFLVEARQAGGERGRRVTVHQDQVGARRLENRFQALDHACCPLRIRQETGG